MNIARKLLSKTGGFFTTLVCILPAENVTAQLQVAAGTYWICDSSSHTYTVLNDLGIEYYGDNEQIGTIFKFTGTATAVINGNATSLYNIIEIAKTGVETLILSQNINVLNRVSFVSGMLDLNGHVLNLIDNAYLTGEKEGSGCIGPAGGYLQATVTLNAPVNHNPGNIGITLISESDLGKTVIRRGHAIQHTGVGNSGSIRRYYDISPQNNNRLSASLQFGYLDNELNGINEDDLTLVKQETDIDPWKNIGTDVRNTVENYVRKNNITRFSRWTLSSLSIALPVQWKFFNINCQQDKILISWSTESEFNTKSFIVQRSSDGIVWESIFQQNAGGNSIGIRNYRYEDKQPVSGDLYYRIMQTDLDGRFSYSPVLKSVCDVKEEVKVYPNPATEAIWISFYNNHLTAHADIRLYNALGAMIYHDALLVQQGRCLFKIPLSFMPRGMYTVAVIFQGKIKHYKIIRQ